MKIITVKFRSRPETKIELIELCRSMLKPSRQEGGCIQYHCYQDIVEDDSFFFYEEWKDQSSIDFHFSTKHFIEFQSRFNTLINGEAILIINEG